MSSIRSGLKQRRIALPLLIVLSLVLAGSITAVTFLTIGNGTASATPTEQTGGNVPRMPALAQQFALLAEPDNPPELHMDALKQIVSLVLGPPVILPTIHKDGTGEVLEETTAFHNRVQDDMREAILVWTKVKTDASYDPETRALANEVSVFMEGAQSVIDGLAQRVADLDPRDPLPSHLTGKAEIESPFLIWPRQRGHFASEQVMTGKIAEGETLIVLKEFFGLKAVLFHRIIPVYQEPWSARVSPIIGFKVVWFIRWLPAEHLKTISYTRSNSGKLIIKVTQKDILDTGLTKMWRFFSTGNPGVQILAP